MKTETNLPPTTPTAAAPAPAPAPEPARETAPDASQLAPGTVLPATDAPAAQQQEQPPADPADVVQGTEPQEQPAEKPVKDDAPRDPKTGLRTDGPTLEQYVAAGYKAETYPPAGYADKRTPKAPAAKPQAGLGRPTRSIFHIAHDPTKSGIGFGHARGPEEPAKPAAKPQVPAAPEKQPAAK